MKTPIKMMKIKIGLFNEDKDDEILINNLLTLMKNENAAKYYFGENFKFK